MKECERKQGFLKRILFAFALALCATVVLSGRPVQAGESFSLDAYTPQEWESDPQECDEASDMAEMLRKWWQAPMQAVLKASVSVGNTTFSKVSGGALRLLTTGSLLWLALLILKVVGSMTESDPMEWMTQVGGMMIKVGFAAALLKNRDYFFSYFFSSVIQAGAGFVDAGGVSFGKGGLSEASSAIMGIANSIHESIGKLTGKGSFLSCMAKIHIIDFDLLSKPWGPFVDPGAWSAGCMIRACGWFMMAAFPFYLMDACFRMGVTAALCPLFIVAWVFKSTRDFTQKGFNALLNVAFMFMIMKIVALITTNMLMSAAGVQGLSKGNAADYVCKFRWIYISKDGVSDPCNGKPKDFLMPLVLFVCLIYSLMLMTKVEQIANHFSGASFSNDAFFQAAKSVGRGMNNAVTMGVGGAFAAKDRMDLHKDRAAARTVEKDRQAREKANAAGRTYTPSPKEAKKVEAARQRLKRAGAIRADGSETQRYADLLKNGKARTAMNLLATPLTGIRTVGAKFGLGSKKEFFKDVGNTYNGMRGKEEVQKLKEDK